jgi:hypothetical protein
MVSIYYCVGVIAVKWMMNLLDVGVSATAIGAVEDRLGVHDRVWRCLLVKRLAL